MDPEQQTQQDSVLGPGEFNNLSPEERSIWIDQNTEQFNRLTEQALENEQALKNARSQDGSTRRKKFREQQIKGTSLMTKITEADEQNNSSDFYKLSDQFESVLAKMSQLIESVTEPTETRPITAVSHKDGASRKADPPSEEDEPSTRPRDMWSKVQTWWKKALSYNDPDAIRQYHKDHPTLSSR